MSREEGGDDAAYKVVVDHGGQYSIWPADRENALGWSDAGKAGTREECLEYIEEVGKGGRGRGRREEEGRKVDDGGGGFRGDL